MAVDFRDRFHPLRFLTRFDLIRIEPGTGPLLPDIKSTPLEATKGRLTSGKFALIPRIRIRKS